MVLCNVNLEIALQHTGCLNHIQVPRHIHLSQLKEPELCDSSAFGTRTGHANMLSSAYLLNYQLL